MPRELMRGRLVAVLVFSFICPICGAVFVERAFPFLHDWVGRISPLVSIFLICWILMRRGKMIGQLQRSMSAMPVEGTLAAGLTRDGALRITRDAVISYKGKPDALAEDGVIPYAELNELKWEPGLLGLRWKTGAMSYFEVEQPQIWLRTIRKVSGLPG